MRRGMHGSTTRLMVLAALMTPAIALGFVPHVGSILRDLAERRENLKLRDISLQLTAEVAGNDAPVDERFYLKAPERVRLVVDTGKGTTLYVEREGKRAAGPEAALRKLSGVTDLTGALFMPMGQDVDEKAKRLLSVLKAANVNTAVVALGLQDGTVAYIIGARPFEPEKPQVWLSKANLQPLRTILLDASKSPPSLVETRFLEYGSQIAGDYFPGVIEVYRDGKLTRRTSVQKAAVNQALPETLFDLSRAR